MATEVKEAPVVSEAPVATAPVFEREHLPPVATENRAIAEDAGRTGAVAFLAFRIVFVAAVCVGAYRYSLLTLLDGLSLTSPLAYLALVPVIALMLATVRALQARNEPDIHDSYLDWIVGLPLLAGALLILTVAGDHLSTYFWLWRLDLLSLPLFVAGVIVLAFGARALWRLRVPIVFLGLASPAPYLLLANGRLGFLKEGTLAALRELTSLLSLAQPLQGADGSLFLVPHTGRDFILRVNPGSAGVESVLGVLLVGVAVAALVAGPVMGRLGWLVAGAVLIWVLDLLRVLALFAAGRAWGEAGALQPFAGLAAFVVGALAMVAVLPWFRLQVAASPLGAAAAPGVATRPARRPLRRLAVRRALPALAVLLAAGVLAARADDGLSPFEAVATPLGQPLLAPEAASSHAVAGWSLRRTQSYPWIASYMGGNASWERYEYSPLPGAGRQRGEEYPLTLDLFTTYDRGSLSAYGIPEAYHLNRYRLVESSRDDLGGGVVGTSVLYRSKTSNQTWSAVYWDWPVRTSRGLAYQRVVVNDGRLPEVRQPVTVRDTEPTQGPTPGTVGQAGAGASGAQRLDDSSTRRFLVGFGRQVVSVSTGSPAPRAVRP